MFTSVKARLGSAVFLTLTMIIAGGAGLLGPHYDPRLLVYGRHGLLETLELPLQPNEQRLLR